MNQGFGVEDRSWRFLTNHALVLDSIVGDLVEAGYLTRTRVGRRNEYVVHDELPLRHSLHSHHTVAELIAFLEGPATEAERTS